MSWFKKGHRIRNLTAEELDVILRNLASRSELWSVGASGSDYTAFSIGCRRRWGREGEFLKIVYSIYFPHSVWKSLNVHLSDQETENQLLGVYDE